MNEDFDQMLLFFGRSYALEHTPRYSTVPTIKKESVASHCFFVALGVRLLHSFYEFNLEKALCMALSHDMAEIETGDVLHSVKKRNPKLAAVIKEIENAAAETFPVSIAEDLAAYSQPSVEADIVHLADTIQVWQYTNAEMLIGNFGPVVDIHESSQDRADALIAKLQPALRTNYV